MVDLDSKESGLGSQGDCEPSLGTHNAVSVREKKRTCWRTAREEKAQGILPGHTHLCFHLEPYRHAVGLAWDCHVNI